MYQHLFRPIEITSVITDKIVCNHTAISFFELVFIEQGTGIQRIDQAHIPFADGAVFMLLPDERCTIELASLAQVHLIRFLPGFLAKTTAGDKPTSLIQLEFIRHSPNRQVYPLLADSNEQHTLTNLIRVLITEYQTHHEASHNVQKHLLYAILAIIVRNLGATGQTTTIPKNQALLSFIQYHITEPDQLTIRALAGRFGIAGSYFSEYFQATFGLSLKHYITEHKLNLVDSRLRYTALSISEIAAELGFTDSSHLKRTYWRYRQKNLPDRVKHTISLPQNVH